LNPTPKIIVQAPLKVDSTVTTANAPHYVKEIMQKFEAYLTHNLALAEKSKATSNAYFSRPRFDQITQRWNYTGNNVLKKKKCLRIATVYKARKASIEYRYRVAM